MSPAKSETDSLKQTAADWAVRELDTGMVVGLGSGSTAKLAVDAIGRRITSGLRIVGIPTSERTANQARGLGIPLSTLGEHPEIDATIDGADEVEIGTLNLIKGGGGNHLREKIVASASSRLVIAVDESKMVSHLGDRAKVPVEVAQFGWQTTAHKLKNLHCAPILRLDSEGKPFVTDGGNFILDCAFGRIGDAKALAGELDSIVGVIEHGLFIGLTALVVIGTSTGVKRLDRKSPWI
ncbi:MAG: ribose-5-phosphate isomerase RpiA [Acidobacteriaceae bacterium]|nr:ribose-5-phosphate isomerase RpiA [Acidobacteriaceae bacterium]